MHGMRHKVRTHSTTDYLTQQSKNYLQEKNFIRSPLPYILTNSMTCIHFNRLPADGIPVPKHVVHISSALRYMICS